MASSTSCLHVSGGLKVVRGRGKHLPGVRCSVRVYRGWSPGVGLWGNLQGAGVMSGVHGGWGGRVAGKAPEGDSIGTDIYRRGKEGSGTKACHWAPPCLLSDLTGHC